MSALDVLEEEVEGEVVVETLAVNMEFIDLPVVQMGSTLGAGVRRRRRYFCNRTRRSSLCIAPTLRSTVIIARS